MRPFDYEGVAKGKTLLIEKGVARTPAYDTRTAARAGTTSTGHALPEPNTFGPYPLNLVMYGGDASLAEMIASTNRGLFVSRLHYTNPVDPKRTVITGMTRFGTFLIEDGAVTRAVRSMRFTDSVLGGLSRVEAVGNELRRVGDALAPALKLSSWRFTGVTGA
jgi:predicted Zn-dependent protease